MLKRKYWKYSKKKIYEKIRRWKNEFIIRIFIIKNHYFIFYKTKVMKENNELKSYFFYFLILPIFFQKL